MMSAFPDLHSFWHMGGYAGTVWPAYGIVGLVLLLQVVQVKYKWRRLRKALTSKYVKSS